MPGRPGSLMPGPRGVLRKLERRRIAEQAHTRDPALHIAAGQRGNDRVRRDGVDGGASATQRPVLESIIPTYLQLSVNWKTEETALWI